MYGCEHPNAPKAVLPSAVPNPGAPQGFGVTTPGKKPTVPDLRAFLDAQKAKLAAKPLPALPRTIRPRHRGRHPPQRRQQKVAIHLK